jgi:hypothetical protein
VLCTPKPIPKDIHNIRLVCKAAKAGAQAQFQRTFFSSRRITFDAGSLERRETLVAESDSLTREVQSLAFIADATEAEKRQHKLDDAVLRSECQHKINNLTFTNEREKNEVTERIIKIIEHFINEKSVALLDTETGINRAGGGHFATGRGRMFRGAKTTDSQSVFLSRMSMRSSTSSRNWNIETTLRFFWHVLRSIPNDKVEDFTFFAETNFLDFENTHYRVDFQFLQHLRSFTWIGDKCRAKDWNYIFCYRCSRSKDGKCPHTPPAPYVVQLKRFSNQASNLKKLEVESMHIFQSVFWDSPSGNPDKLDPLRNLEELVLWKSDIYYEKLISLLNRAPDLRRLALNDVYLSRGTVEKSVEALIRVKSTNSWSDFFRYFFEEGPKNCLDIDIEGMLWNSSRTYPWMRTDMLRLFGQISATRTEITILRSEILLERKLREAPK